MPPLPLGAVVGVVGAEAPAAPHAEQVYEGDLRRRLEQPTLPLRQPSVGEEEGWRLGDSIHIHARLAPQPRPRYAEAGGVHTRAQQQSLHLLPRQRVRRPQLRREAAPQHPPAAAQPVFPRGGGLALGTR